MSLCFIIFQSRRITDNSMEQKGKETGNGEAWAELASSGCPTKVGIEMTCQALGQAGGSCP